MHPFKKLANQLSPVVVQDDPADTDWTRLLLLANLHKCTPLWYLRLRQKGLLNALPEGLADYLKQLHAVNVERNQALMQALAEITGWFGAAGIEVVLLKGAAALADDLYGDAGARLMGDLDLLVPAERAAEAQQLLLQKGYLVAPEDEEKIVYRLPTDAEYHLEPLYLPDTGIVVEIHHRVMSRQGGRALPVDQVWADRIPAPGFPGHVFLPAPGWRLLHNALHALLPYGEFIRAQIQLNNLAEAAALLQRDRSAFDRGPWEAAARNHALKEELRAYAQLLQFDLGVTFIELDHSATPQRLVRLLEIGGARQLVPPNQQENMQLRRHYLFRLPGYAWRNVCYAPGWWRLPERVGCLLTRGLRRNARRKLRR